MQESQGQDIMTWGRTIYGGPSSTTNDITLKKNYLPVTHLRAVGQGKHLCTFL